MPHSRLAVIEGPSGRLRRAQAERARIAAESLMPGVQVADVARRHATSRWQVYDWRRQLRTEQLVLPESVAALPMCAELAVEGATAEASSAGATSEVVDRRGDLVIRAGWRR